MAQTSIAASSNGASLPQGTINVVSTAGFASAGTLYIYSDANCTVLAASDNVSLPTSNIVVNNLSHFATSGKIIVTTNPSSYPQLVNYTGQSFSPTTFTGCSGGTGVLNTGAYITQAPYVVNYTGTTSTSFTGCTSSDVGVLITGFAVYEQPTNSTANDISAAIKQDIITGDPALIENSTYDNALPTYYKIKGLYPPTGLFEVFVVVGRPTNINPTNNHVLTNTTVLATWISEKVTANVSSS